MVVLAIATSTAIPTALRTRIILGMQTQFIQLEVWIILEEYLVPTEICSPGTGGFDANYAWNVDKSGNIPLFSDHENSYGILRSPAIDTVADSIFYVATNGGAYISDYISTYSYGHHFICSPDNRFNTAWWVGLSGVCDSWMRDGVTYSYGSPGTNDTSYAWLVYLDGVVDAVDVDVIDSYGNLLSEHELFKRCMEYFKFW